MKHGILLGFLIIFFAVSLRGEEGSSVGTVDNADMKIITVNECISIALQNHPDIYISEESKKQAIAKYKIVRGENSLGISGEIKTLEYLKASSNSSNSAFNIPGRDTNIGIFAGLTAKYNIYDAQRDEMLDTAKIAIDLAKIEEQIKIAEILMNVKKAYLGFYLACENQILQEQLLEKAINKHKQAQMLFQNGARPILDVSKAEIEVNEARLEMEKARNRKSIMWMNLLSSMGLKEESARMIRPQRFTVLPELKYSLEELYKLMDLYNPSIKHIRLRKKMSRLQISVERAAHIPKVDIIFALGYENRHLHGLTNGASDFGRNFEANNWSPAFSGSFRAYLPVYSGGAISARVDNAIAEYNKMGYNEDETIITFKNMLVASYRSIGELARQYAMSDLIIENARKHLLLAQRSYENGVGSQLDLKDAEVTVIKAEQDKLTTLYSYFMALATIANIIGLDEAQICR